MTEQKITSIKQLIPPSSILPVKQAGEVKTVKQLINLRPSKTKFCNAYTAQFQITIWKRGTIDIGFVPKDEARAEITVPAKDFFAVLDRLGFDFKQEEGGES